MLAWLKEEPGADRVRPLLGEAIVTAANWAEILQKVRQHRRDAIEAKTLLRSLGIDVVPVIDIDGEFAASIWSAERPLSLGDRLCLAVAARLGLPAVTAEVRWTEAGLDLEVQLIR